MATRGTSSGERFWREIKKGFINLFISLIAAAVAVLLVWYVVRPKALNMLKKSGEDSRARIEKVKSPAKP